MRDYKTPYHPGHHVVGGMLVPNDYNKHKRYGKDL